MPSVPTSDNLRGVLTQIQTVLYTYIYIFCTYRTKADRLRTYSTKATNNVLTVLIADCGIIASSTIAAGPGISSDSP